MSGLFSLLIFTALAAVLVALGLGLYTLARGSKDRQRSNRLMQWRIALQGIAIIIILVAVVIGRGH